MHSHEEQIIAMLELALRRGARDLYLHAFLDGCDREIGTRRIEHRFANGSRDSHAGSATVNDQLELRAGGEVQFIRQRLWDERRHRLYDEPLEVGLLAGKKCREAPQSRFLEWVDTDDADAPLG